MIQTVSFQAMASPVTWTADGAGEDVHVIGDVIRKTFQAVEKSLSRFREDSELSRLNGGLGQVFSASDILYDAVAISSRAWKRTGGRFDPRVIRDLERMGYHGAPITGGVSSARPGPWCRRAPRDRTVTLYEPIDFGGIGKSLAVNRATRQALDLWRSRLPTTPSFILNAGGDLGVIGPGPDNTGWVIGIEHPARPETLIAALRLKGPRGVCTSSVARRRWTWQGKTVHHLIDPRTHGPGGEGLLSVTVIHRSTIWAEIWSKTLFLAGAGNIRREALRRGGPVWWVTEEGRLYMTPDAEALTEWIHPDNV